MNQLTLKQKQRLYRDGYLVLRQVVPKEMLNRLPHPLSDEPEAARA